MTGEGGRKGKYINEGRTGYGEKNKLLLECNMLARIQNCDHDIISAVQVQYSSMRRKRGEIVGIARGRREGGYLVSRRSGEERTGRDPRRGFASS